MDDSELGVQVRYAKFGEQGLRPGAGLPKSSYSGLAVLPEGYVNSTLLGPDMAIGIVLGG
jgi:hypothetical protein